MNTGFQFAYKKATQALNFFAIENGGEIEKLHALKLIFFADRYHLRKYGRPITNDQYWAMRLGPVPSGTKDLFELDSASNNCTLSGHLPMWIIAFYPRPIWRLCVLRGRALARGSAL